MRTVPASWLTAALTTAVVMLLGTPALAGSKGYYSSGSQSDATAMPDVGPDHYLLYPPRRYETRHLAATYPDPERRNNFYGHAKVVQAVVDVSAAVRERHPEAPRLPIGELSNASGGKIPLHLSHQNGLDVDVFFLVAPEPRLCRDGPRFEHNDPAVGEWAVDLAFNRSWNWTVASAFAARSDVKTIFIGKLLREELGRWAKANGVPEAERRRTMRKLYPVFCRSAAHGKSPFYRGNWCPHDDHFHVRFKCPAGSSGCRDRKR